MAGFFRKVASAFVEFEDDESDRESAPQATFDDITRGTSELLAQLEGIQAAESGQPIPEPSQPDVGSSPDPVAPARPPSPPLAAGLTRASGTDATAQRVESAVMAMTAEDVFLSAGIEDGPNSASRVLKLIAGLSMFPPEQQVIMVRAMDSADETWSETEVLADARARQSALRSHLQVLEDERNHQLESIDARIDNTRQTGAQVLDEIDRQIQELQSQREAAIAETTHAVDELEQQKREVETHAEHARHGITHVINALSSLLGFFADGQAAPARNGKAQ
ncbi:MAG: hypothetical protein MJE77_32985 [Proteobacteria bacterium]|nr:hypothetical protein [Pseudomonadota bacterium]